MAAAETARLIASLELQDKNFTRGIKNVERGVNRVDKKLGAFSGFVNRNMGRAIDSIALKFTSAITSGLGDLAELESATTSVTGAINQMGLKGQVTAAQIATWANEIETNTKAAFDDKAIVQATTTLIRYGKITKDNIKPAMEIITDLAAKTGDVESASSLLAKALADPAKAAGKLKRAGVVLTKQQEKQIKAMVKSGDVAGAQALLLDALSTATKGAAKASAGPYQDALNQFADATEDARKALAVGFLPVITKVAKLLSTELAKPGTLKAITDFGNSLGDVFDEIVEAARDIPWSTIGTSLKLAGAGAKIVLDAFLGLPPWIQTAVLTGWGLNKLSGGLLGDIASGLIKGVLGINAGVVNINAATVNGGGVPGGAGGGGGVVSKIGSAVRILGAVTIAGGSIVLLAQTFMDFIKGVGEQQTELLGKVERTSSQGFTETIANLKATNAGIKNMNPLENVLAGIFGGSEIVKNFEMATDRIRTSFEKGELTRTEMVTAIGALEETLRLNPEVELPGTESLLKDLIAAVNSGKVSDRKPPSKPLDKVDPLNKIDNKPVVANIVAMKNAIKNAQSIASRENSAQNAELGNIKNATATLDANTKAGLIAATAATTAGNLLSVFQSASQVLAQGSTTTAVEGTTTAARNAGLTASAAMGQAATRIVGAVNALDLSVNVTTVNRTSTVNNRYGPSGGSSTTQRAGGNTG